MIEVEQIRIIAGLAMLSISSGIDIWKREIHDYYWLIFGAIALVISVIFWSESYLVRIGYAMIIAPIALIVWRMGLFGGADAFALIVLAGLCPVLTLSQNPVTPLTTLSNAAILIIIPISLNLIRNSYAVVTGQRIFEGFEESRGKKIAASMIGHKSKNPKYGFSIEELKEGKKKFSLRIHNAETAEFCTSPNTWITQGIPYLLLITGGFIIQLIFGDIFLNFFKMF